MRRILILLAFLMLPLSVLAMTPLSDSELVCISGQAGVNIQLDVTTDICIATLAWGDDGITGVYNPWSTVPTGGYIGFNNLKVTNLRIRPRTESTDNYNFYNSLLMRPITIDVATGTKLGVADTTFVRISPGALKISIDELQTDVALGPHVGTKISNDPVLNQKLGVVSLGAIEVYVNPFSNVDIYSHTNHGVNFDVNLTLDRISIPYMSWGRR